MRTSSQSVDELVSLKECVKPIENEHSNFEFFRIKNSCPGGRKKKRCRGHRSLCLSARTVAAAVAVGPLLGVDWTHASTVRQPATKTTTTTRLFLTKPVVQFVSSQAGLLKLGVSQESAGAACQVR